MADATLQKLLNLLDPGQSAAVRSAAALVLGEVGSADKKLAGALTKALEDPESTVRIHAMTAIGKHRIDTALPHLVDVARGGGEEGEAAAVAAARLGSKGIKAIQKLMDTVPPGLKRRLASALAAAGTTSAESAAVDALLDADPGVVDASARTLIGQVPTLTSSQRRALVEHVVDLLKPRKGDPFTPASESALLRLLSALGDQRGEAIYWARIGAKHPPEIQASALLALGALPPPTDKKKIQTLIECAGQRNFRIVAPALMILKAIPVSGKTDKDWLPLLQAPDPAVRQFAIEKLGEIDTKEMAAALAQQVHHHDRNLRELALGKLVKLKHGREALVAKLLDSSTDDAWFLARAQAPLAADYPAPLRTRLFQQACKHLEAGSPLADPLLFLLRKHHAQEVRDGLTDRALELRKKKKYEQALIYLRMLGRDPACGQGTRWELAGCGLKLSAKNLAGDARTADPCLQQIGRLVHDHDTEPMTWMKQTKWLDAEDLFYLGFHFAEMPGPEKQFGGEVLRLMVKRYPKAKKTKDAKRKLRSEGFD